MCEHINAETSHLRLLIREVCGLTWILVMVAYSLYQVRLGFDLTDEGMYLSTAMRYAQGDYPFRDEIMNPFRLFDIILSAQLRWFPGTTVLQFRQIGLGIHLLSALTLYTLFRRVGLSPFLSGFAVTCQHTISTIIWTPSYNLMGVHFCLIGACLYLHAWMQEPGWWKRILACAAGLASLAAALSHVLVAPTIMVPLIIELWGRKAGSRPDGTSLLWFYGAVFASLLFCALLVSHYGLWADWIDAVSVFRSVSAYGRTMPEKVSLLLRGIVSGSLLHMAFGAAFLVYYVLVHRFSSNTSRIRWRIAFSLAIVLSGVTFWRIVQSSGNQLMSLTGVAVLFISLAVAVFLIRFREWMKPHAASSRVFLLLFLDGLFLLGTLCMFSSNQPLVMTILGLPVVVPVLVLGLFSPPLQGIRTPCKRMVDFTTFLFVFATALAAHILMHGYVYRDAPPSQLTASFSHEKLRGIYSTPGRVETLDALLSHLPSAAPGDDGYLLAYDEIPALYYLTGMRPALNVTWATSRTWPLPVQQSSVEYMERSDRLSHIAVRALGHPALLGMQRRRPLRYSDDPEEDPVHGWVVRNLTLHHTIDIFEIWKGEPVPE